MKAFNNFGKSDEYQPIIDLSNGKYIVNFDKVNILENEKIFKNSKLVGTGKKVPTGNATWRSIIFTSKPTSKMIQNTIFDIINAETSYNIENTFKWKGYNVHLDKENQMNYKNAFDIALSTDGSNLPVTFKFNKSGKTNYYTFDSVEELKDFYLAVNKHITSCLKAGWNAKDRLDINDYK